MKMWLALLLSLTLTAPVLASASATDKPVEHMEVAKITSMEEAKTVFVDKTREMKSKADLTVAQLQEIHIITYTLEQSIAYFTENLKGTRQAQAKQMAVVVEEIHLASENNRQAETRQSLNEYFKLADQFSKGF